MEENKLNVIIVEDEYRIGMLIRKLIDWERLNLNFTHLLNNGEKALEVILEEKPDIVITDIQMPIISGLELIKKAREANMDLEYVVISGYKDFEYAHTALEYGVNSYLLKPIKEDELNNVLERLSNNINKKRKSLEENNKIREKIKLSKKIIDSKILKEIIESDIPIEYDYIKDKYDLSFNFSKYRIVDIKLDYRDYKKADKKQDIITIEETLKIIDAGLSSEKINRITYVDDSLNIFCMINYDINISEEVKEYLNKTLIALEDYLLGFEQYEVSIGIGSEKDEFIELKESYREAVLAVQNRISIGTRTIIFYKSSSYNVFDKFDKDFEKHLSAYINSVKSYDVTQFRKISNEIFNKASTYFSSDFAYLYYYLSNKLIHLFFDNLKDLNESSKELRNYLLNIYLHCYLDIQLKKLIYYQLGNYLEEYKIGLETKYTKPVRDAKKYVEENFSKKITLDEVAAIVDLNPVYLSVVFKKETGHNFSDYILKFKMEKAKEMLKNENETIAAVAAKLGYKDSRYFSKLFLKTVGLKPTVFRRLYS